MCRRKGIGLVEVVCAVATVGILMLLAFLSFNYANLLDNSTDVKHSKISSALQSATKSILVNEKEITVAQACDPIAMRDLYLARLMNASVISNVSVNGKSLPALQIPDYGVIAFEASTDCEKKWQPADSSAIIGTPVVLYAVAGNQSEIVVPNSVTANGGSDETSSSSLTPSTMAFSLNPSGIKNTYDNTSASTQTLAATTQGSQYVNTTSACQAGSSYEYISSTCTDASGKGVSVKFYEMLNETGCRVSYCPGNGYNNQGELVTSGMVNTLCKLGTGNGSVGQCACPAGKEFYVPRYVVENSSIAGVCIASCDEFNMVHIGGNQCDCPAGSTWNPSINKCVVPGVCDRDYLKWDDATASCICKTSAELVQMNTNYFEVCEVYDAREVANGCKRLRENWDISTGSCICPVPLTQSGVNCTCADPRTMTNNGCVCDISKVTLADNEIFVDDIYNQECKTACDASKNEVPSADKLSCVCKTNEVRVNDVCTCVAPFASNQNGECVCPSPKVQSGNTCVCPAVGSAEANTIISQLIQADDNRIYNRTAESCVSQCDTANNMVPNVTRTACIPCPQGYRPNTQGSACVLACDPVVIGGVNVPRELDATGACACQPWGEFTTAQRNAMIFALDAQNAIYSENTATCTAQCIEFDLEYETHTCTENSNIITLECGEKCVGATAYNCQTNHCGCVSELDAREYDETEFKLNLGERNTWDRETYFDYVAFCKTCVEQREYDGVTVPTSPIAPIGCVCPDIATAKMQANLSGNLVYDINEATCASECPANTYAQLPLHDVCLPCDVAVADVVNNNNVFSCQCNRVKTENFIATAGLNAIFVDDISVGCMEDCPAGLVAVNGACICPQSNTTLINGTCQCRPETPENAQIIETIKATLDTSKKEYYDSNAHTTNCISVCNMPNYSYNATDKTCECASPRIEPECTCPSGQAMFDAGYLTETQYREAGELDCVRACTVGQTHNTTAVVGYDGKTYAPYETCMCAHPFEWDAQNKQCVCKEAWDFNTATHGCECNLGRTYVDANNEVQCTCPLVMDNLDITKELVIENGNKSCQCPTDPQAIDAIKAELRKVANNKTIYDVTSPTCFSECDETRNLIPNAELNACVCNSANGFVMVDGQCVCDVIYQDAVTGYTLRKDGSSGVCVCPDEEVLYTSAGADMQSELARQGKIYNKNTSSCISNCTDYDSSYVIHSCPGVTVLDTRYACGPRCYGAKVWDCTSTPNQCHCSTSMSYIPPADEFILYNGEERTWNTAYAENNYCKQCDIYRDATQEINSATESLGCTCSPEMYDLRQPGQIVDELATACISNCSADSYADMATNECIPCNSFPFLKPDNINELCDCADEDTLDPAQIANWLKFGERYDATQFEHHCTSCVVPRFRDNNDNCMCPSGLDMFNNGLLDLGQYRNYTKENCVDFCAAGKAPNDETVTLHINGKDQTFAPYETCVCVYPFVPNNENNEICQCDLPWTPSQNGMACECNDPFVVAEVDGVNRCLCPIIIDDIREEMNAEKDACFCPAYGTAAANQILARLQTEDSVRVYNPNAVGCIQTCDTANGFIPNATRTACVCPSNMTDVNGVCQCLDPFVMSGGACVCPSPKLQDGNSCYCPALGSPEAQAILAQLATEDGTRIYNPQAPSCFETCDTAKGFVPNAQRTECVCRTNTTLVNGVCQCLDPFEDVNGVCGCPNPRYQDGNSCICPAMSQTTIPDGYIYNIQEKACVEECDKSKHNIPNSRKDMCICDPNHAAYFYDTAEQCGCPTGSTRTKVSLLSFDMINFEYDVYVCQCNKQCGPYDVPMMVNGTCQCVYDPLVVDYDKDSEVEAALGCGVDLANNDTVYMCATKGDKMLAINELNSTSEIDGTKVFSTETIDPFENGKAIGAANGFEALYELAISAAIYADENEINTQVITTDGFVELEALKYLLNQIGWDIGLISDNNVNKLETLGHVSAISTNYYEQEDEGGVLEERQVGTYRDTDNALHKVADIWVRIVNFVTNLI